MNFQFLKMKKKIILFILNICIALFCFAQKVKIQTIDKNATYGHGWVGDENRSDVKSVTGAHPAVIGVDFSGLYGPSESEIEKEKTSLIKYISETYDRGVVITAAWHFNNPVSNTNFYWNDSTAIAAVKNIYSRWYTSPKI